MCTMLCVHRIDMGGGQLFNQFIWNSNRWNLVAHAPVNYTTGLSTSIFFLSDITSCCFYLFLSDITLWCFISMTSVSYFATDLLKKAIWLNIPCNRDCISYQIIRMHYPGFVCHKQMWKCEKNLKFELANFQVWRSHVNF